MLDFMMNNKEYEFGSDSNLASILAQFDTEYIMHVISDTLEIMFNNFDTLPKPNAVSSYKLYFNELYDQYPQNKEEIMVVEYDTYRDTIDIISKKYGFIFTEVEDLDMYTMAFYVYDFFVSKFNYYLINFYSRYLNEQKESIASNMNLEELKQNKDMSTVYGYQIFGEDNPLWIITANLPQVLTSISTIEIPDDIVYRYAYGDNDMIISLFTNHITPGSTLFNIYNRILFNPILSATVMTQIRLKIQQDYAEVFTNNNDTKSI